MESWLMRFILGFLSGVLGALGGWVGLAMLVIAFAGPDRDGGIAMGAFFNIGPIGGIVGFITGVLLFIKFGIVVRQNDAPADPPPPHTAAFETTLPAPAVAPTRVSPVFAVAILTLTAGLAWWGWYELIRSPYLSHGFMTLDMQFRLPPGMALPAEATDVHITVTEGSQYGEGLLGRAWHGTDGDRRVILASATLDRKTSHRIVSLQMPGVAEQSWQLDLANDPDPTPGYSPWRLSSRSAAVKIEMNFRLSADR